jgi:hypothetical protein
MAAADSSSDVCNASAVEPATTETRVTIILASGSKAPKWDDLQECFHGKKINLICQEPPENSVLEPQTQHREFLGRSKWKQSKEVLRKDPAFMERLRSLPGFDPKECFLWTEDTSLYFGHLNFPGTLIKMFTENDAYANRLLEKALPDTTEGRYICSVTFGPFFEEGEVCFLEAEVRGELVPPEGKGKIDNQLRLYHRKKNIAVSPEHRLEDHPRNIVFRMTANAMGLEL